MSTQMMKAVQQHAFGGPEVLSYEDAPMPVLQAGEVLVQVHAVGVNPPDSYLRDGYQQLPPEWRPEVRFPLILGTDLSGVVVARADDVREVAVGDEVYAMARFPEGAAGGSRAYAEYVSVPVSDLARKPLTLSHQQAAAVPMSLLTAWQFMIDPGMRWRIRCSRGRIGRCRWRVNASWSTVRQGESVISPCSWQSGRAPR